MDRLVDVRGLALTCGRHRRLAPFDLVVEPGRTIGLVGPNGAGKTTILRLLAGLLRPSEGTGHVLGRDIRRASRTSDVRPAYLPQAMVSRPELTVGELLRFRATINDATDARTVAIAAMELAGIAYLEPRRLGTLSGGWLRRTELAATIVADPALLLLDEPTTGLDHDARAAIWALLSGLAGRGKGIVVNTHDLREAERCDHVVLMIEGRIAATGSPAALRAATGANSLEAAWPLLVDGVAG